MLFSSVGDTRRGGDALAVGGRGDSEEEVRLVRIKFLSELAN